MLTTRPATQFAAPDKDTRAMRIFSGRTATHTRSPDFVSDERPA